MLQKTKWRRLRACVPCLKRLSDEAKNGEKADCIGKYMSILSHFLTRFLRIFHDFLRQGTQALIWLAALQASLILLCSAPVFAQPLPVGIKQAATIEGITEYQLDNGLKILLFPDASKPTVTVNMTYLVGSRHENYGETGMAHLLEHLMFKGTPTHRHLDQEFNQRGMRANASTGTDRTNYYEIFDANPANLKWAIAMEADRMVNAFIAKNDLDSEMTVVRNEFEEGENSPMSMLIKRVQGIAYDWHSYGRPTIGNRSDIEHVGIRNLQAFYRLYYQPDNAVLTIAGKFDAPQALQWIAEAFKPLPKPQRTLPTFWTVEPTQDGERTLNLRRKGDLQIVTVTYKIPAALHADSDPLAYALDILTDTPNGRLYKELVESGKAAQVFSNNLSGVAPGLATIGAIVKQGEAIEPVRKALTDAMENFYQHPPTAQEMQRVRRNYTNIFEKLLADPEKMGLVLSDYIALGDWRLLFYSRDTQDKITAAQVSAAAGRYFQRDNRIIGIFLPENQPRRATIAPAPEATTLLRGYQPRSEATSGEIFDTSNANIDRRTERKQIGGLKIALLTKKTRNHTVSVSLNLHWGNEKNLFGKSLIASMTADMLTWGTQKFSRQQLADEFEKLKISGDLQQFETTRDNLPAALALVAHVLKQPTFPEKEFEQLRKQILVSLEAQRNELAFRTQEVISQHFNRYPKNDWRGFLTLDEQIAQLKTIQLADIKNFYHDFYGASVGELAIVGDADRNAVFSVIEREFAQWKSKQAYAPLLKRNFEVSVLIKQLDIADKENGFYNARLNLDLNEDDADFPALLLANYIFGGESGLDSRLLNRIRQKEGLSYGGGSTLTAGRIDRAGSLTIKAISNPQNLAKTTVAIKEELENLLQKGLTDTEIARAKSGLLQQRQQSRARDEILSALWTRYLYLNRSFNWSEKLENRIRSLTTADINAALRKAIHPEKMSVVIAGDFKSLSKKAKASTPQAAGSRQQAAGSRINYYSDRQYAR